jgi:hypothetical protein
MTHYLRALATRIRGLFGDRGADRELDDEIETHLRLLAERYVRQGMTEAVRAARRQFGNVMRQPLAYARGTVPNFTPRRSGSPTCGSKLRPVKLRASPGRARQVRSSPASPV